MTSYVKFTDFQAKDSLTTGDPLKIIKGQEINDEFNAIQTAVATKADLASPALLGNPTAPTQALGNNSTRIANTAFVTNAIANENLGTIATQDADDVAITGGTITATFTGNLTGNVTGNATTATSLAGTVGSAPSFSCRAWVNFDGLRNASGGSDTLNTNRFIRASGNVSSVLRTGKGLYTITFTTPMEDENYCVVSTGLSNGDSDRGGGWIGPKSASNEPAMPQGSLSNTQVVIEVVRAASTSNNAERQDSNGIYIAIFR